MPTKTARQRAEEIGANLYRAFSHYENSFGEPCHGTGKQISALMEFGVTNAIEAAIKQAVQEERDSRAD